MEIVTGTEWMWIVACGYGLDMDIKVRKINGVNTDIDNVGYGYFLTVTDCIRNLISDIRASLVSVNRLYVCVWSVWLAGGCYIHHLRCGSAVPLHAVPALSRPTHDPTSHSIHRTTQRATRGSEHGQCEHILHFKLL